MEKLNEVKQALKYLEIDAKAYADNFSASMIVSTKNILAIAEAFRALEQEKEAADRYAERLNTLLDDRDATLSRYEAKLAELEKQEHYVEVMKDGPMTICHWMKPAEELPDGTKLFTRPAPAISLADLVPGGWIKCSDQMPEKDVEVQVYCADKKEQMVGYLEENEEEGYFRFATWKNGKGIYCQPTHWKPLAAAPEVE